MLQVAGDAGDLQGNVPGMVLCLVLRQGGQGEGECKNGRCQQLGLVRQVRHLHLLVPAYLMTFRSMWGWKCRWQDVEWAGCAS